MFTGLVQALASVAEVRDEPPGQRLRVHELGVAERAKPGDSIAVNGCCLTAVEIAQGVIAFDVGPETLNRTNLGRLRPGDLVNLERSLRVGDELGGHFVTGHVDGVATLDERRDEGDWSICLFRVPPELAAQMVSKGSVAVDGVSLTVVEVEPDRFSVMLIPHTLSATTLGELSVGGRVNIETDLLGKYVQKLAAAPCASPL